MVGQKNNNTLLGRLMGISTGGHSERQGRWLPPGLVSAHRICAQPAFCPDLGSLNLGLACRCERDTARLTMKMRVQRTPVHRPITLRGENGTRQANLRNISTVGIQVQCETPMVLGAPVAVDILGEPRPATVIWTRGSLTGLKFFSPLSAIEVAAVQRPNATLRGRGGHPAQRRGGMGFSEMR